MVYHSKIPFALNSSHLSDASPGPEAKVRLRHIMTPIIQPRKLVRLGSSSRANNRGPRKSGARSFYLAVWRINRLAHGSASGNPGHQNHLIPSSPDGLKRKTPDKSRSPQRVRASIAFCPRTDLYAPAVTLTINCTAPEASHVTRRLGTHCISRQPVPPSTTPHALPRFPAER